MKRERLTKKFCSKFTKNQPTKLTEYIMKKLTTLLMIALLAISFSACKDDDTTTTDPITPQEPIVGTWVSDGNNVAPLLVALFKITKITAKFNANGTYEVVQTDSANTSLTLTGTYSVNKSTVGEIYTITANQQAPATLTSEGIFEITGTTMKYEVVQTSPSIGAVPPTPAGGFGSTNGGALGAFNVQTYVKQ